MATTPVADDAPAVSAAPESLTSPPGEEQTCSMEVDDGDEGRRDQNHCVGKAEEDSTWPDDGGS